jgi:phenylpropionate dioxygenase-like ring-hydroxylating dioxygenase large terminal subunit
MTTWQDLMPSAALAPGEVVEIRWQGEDLLLYRTTAGECQAIGAYCPHMGNYIPNGIAPGKPLSALLQQDELRCPFHGWRFNGDGQCTHIPQGQRVPEAVRQGRAVVRSWRIREREQQIQIADR